MLIALVATIALLVVGVNARVDAAVKGVAQAKKRATQLVLTPLKQHLVKNKPDMERRLAQGESGLGQFPNIPEACMSVLPEILTLAQDLEKVGDDPNKLFAAICPVYGKLKPCLKEIIKMALKEIPADQTNGIKINTSDGTIDLVMSLIDDVCATVDGIKCYTVMTSFDMTCFESRPKQQANGQYSCPSSQCLLSHDNKQCILKVSDTVFDAVCSQCVVNILAKVTQIEAALKGEIDFPPELPIQDFGLDKLNMAAVNAMRDAVCAKTAAGKFCMKELGMTSGPAATVLSSIGDQTNPAPVYPWPASVTTAACASTDHTICFRRVVGGYFTFNALEEAIERDICLALAKQSGTPTSPPPAPSGMPNFPTNDTFMPLPLLRCERFSTIAQWKLETFNAESASVCSKNAQGALCLSLPAVAQANSAAAAVATFDKCMRHVYAASSSGTSGSLGTPCPADCEVLVKAQTADWGCCGRTLLPALPSIGAGTCSPWFGTVYGGLQGPCALTVTTLKKAKTVFLQIPFADLKNNATAARTLVSAIVNDIAARLGIPTSYMVDRQLVNANDPSEAAAFSRGFRAMGGVVAGGAAFNGPKTNFLFSLQSSSDAETEQLSSSFDYYASQPATSVHSLQLPSATAYAQQQGMLQPGSQASAPAPPPSSPSDDKPSTSTGAVVAAIAAVILVVVVAVILIFVLKRRKSPAHATAHQAEAAMIQNEDRFVARGGDMSDRGSVQDDYLA